LAETTLDSNKLFKKLINVNECETLTFFYKRFVNFVPNIFANSKLHFVRAAVGKIHFQTVTRLTVNCFALTLRSASGSGNWHLIPGHRAPAVTMVG